MSLTKNLIYEEIRIMRGIAIMKASVNLSDLNPEMKCSTCGCKLGWHHAKMKWNGKTLVCYGIACTCEGFTLIEKPLSNGVKHD